MGIEPTPRVMRDTGFEDQGGHQTPNASKLIIPPVLITGGWGDFYVTST